MTCHLCWVGFACHLFANCIFCGLCGGVVASSWFVLCHRLLVCSFVLSGFCLPSVCFLFLLWCVWFFADVRHLLVVVSWVVCRNWSSAGWFGGVGLGVGGWVGKGLVCHLCGWGLSAICLPSVSFVVCVVEWLSVHVLFSVIGYLFVLCVITGLDMGVGVLAFAAWARMVFIPTASVPFPWRSASPC